MRARFVFAIAAAAASAIAGVACIDLLHSTDFETLCDVDAHAPGCSDADAARPPTDFCLWSHAEARDHAARACAWVGACEGPFGGNAFGTCMIHALLAYDCAINPNRRVNAEVHAYWDCVWQAQTCGDVDVCVHGLRALDCSPSDAAYTQCGSAADASDIDPNAITYCPASSARNAPYAVATCLMEGQTCANGECSPSPAAKCLANGCEGTVLHDCDGTHDHGVDCRYFGAGKCVGSGDAGACLATDAGACDASSEVECDGGVARGCPSGVAEAVDCAKLLGATLDFGPSTCGAPARPWDVASACSISSTCSDDGCDPSGTIRSCAQGAVFTTRCDQAGLGACRYVTSPTGGPAHVACAPK